MTTTTVSDTVDQQVRIPTALIRAGRNNRKVFDHDALVELGQSMRTDGQIQPITVISVAHSIKLGLSAPADDGAVYEIVAGERRFRAAVAVGLPTLVAVVRDDLDSRQIRSIMGNENMKRVDITEMEEAIFYRDSMAVGLTIDEIAADAKKTVAHVQKRLDLLSLAPEIQALLAAKRIPPQVAWEGRHLTHDNQVRLIPLCAWGSNMTIQHWRRRILAPAMAAQETMGDLGFEFCDTLAEQPQVDTSPTTMLAFVEQLQAALAEFAPDHPLVHQKPTAAMTRPVVIR